MICNKLEYKCVEKGYHSMKRNLVVLLLFLFFIVVMSMRDFSIYEEEGGKISSEDFAEQAMLVYEKFLEGKIECDGIDIDFITTPKGEPDKRYDTQYAVFDCDGNGEAELHVQSARYYYIFQYKNGALQLYKNLSPYPHYYALKNGAFISHDFGAGPLSDEYRYYIFDTYGNETFSIGFTKYDKNFNVEYDEGDEYVFDNVEVTKDIWEKLTERFLYIDEDGIERIKHEIEWTDLTV